MVGNLVELAWTGLTVVRIPEQDAPSIMDTDAVNYAGQYRAFYL